jgi:hypothetical protein
MKSRIFTGTILTAILIAFAAWLSFNLLEICNIALRNQSMIWWAIPVIFIVAISILDTIVISWILNKKYK